MLSAPLFIFINFIIYYIMAKKQKTKKETVTEEVTQVVEQPKATRELPIKTPENTWEVKDRFYYLSDNSSPVSRSIKSAGIYYFDEELGYERELK